MPSTPAEVQAYRFADTGDIPNHPSLPLLVLKQAVPTKASSEALARAIEAAYQRNGWQGSWRWSVYPYAHYHSTAHEVLTCFRGWANLHFGGAPGVTVAITPGDAVIIPAGVGHQKLDSSTDFQVCGAYPPHQEADLIRADQAERHAAARARIREVLLPETDPLFGSDGPLQVHWSPNRPEQR